MSFWQTLPERALVLGSKILIAILIFVIGIHAIKILRKILKKSMQKAKVETGASQFIDSFVKVLLYMVLIFLLASYCGVKTDDASIVAVLGSMGVALGLAVQGSLSNLAGGIILLLLRPFKVGDYIIENSSGKEGFVTEIHIFYTKLTTIDDKVVVLPNSNLANNTIVNVTATANRCLDVRIGISYKADIKTAKQVLTEVIARDEKVLKDKNNFVVVDDLADSSVVLLVRCWFANEEYWAGKWRITENCKYALDEAGIEIAYPQLDVHVTQ
ncbi:MAG: mechanosensitive ion channel [Acetatifactor sp.]|nr:mechanosensitive ion channel [Acetatifactor sp.]